MKRRLVEWQNSLRLGFQGLVRRAQARLNPVLTFGSKRIVLGALIGFLLVAFMYLAYSSNVAMLAREVRRKQQRIEELNRQNAQLRYEIAALTLPSAIEVRARKLGLGPAKHVVYVDMPWLQSESDEMMPAFLPKAQAAPAVSVATESNFWEQFMALLGFGSRGEWASAQTK